MHLTALKGEKTKTKNPKLWLNLRQIHRECSNRKRIRVKKENSFSGDLGSRIYVLEKWLLYHKNIILMTNMSLFKIKKL